jgi:hypothetical protein
MPFPPSGTWQNNSPEEEQRHYEVSGGASARGFSFAQEVWSPPAHVGHDLGWKRHEEHLRLIDRFLQQFYNTFTGFL